MMLILARGTCSKDLLELLEGKTTNQKSSGFLVSGATPRKSKSADWLVNNDVVWPILHKYACANPRKKRPQPRPQGLLAFQYGGAFGAAILESEKTLGTRLKATEAYRSMVAEREREMSNYKDPQDCCS